MTDCLFCKIIAGEIPAEMVYEDDKIVVFKDINPKAKVHLLVVPRVHFKSLAEATAEHAEILSYINLKLAEIAQQQGLNNGFRTIINTGPDGGQEIDHIHFHILGGGKLPGF